MLKTTLMFISVGAVGATYFGMRPPSPQSDEETRKTADLKVGAGNASSLDVKIPLGDVTLVSDNSSSLTVHVVRWCKAPLDADSRRWMKDSYLSAENHDGVLVVRDHPFGKDSLNNIHTTGGSRSDHGGKNLNLHVEIHVPFDLAAKLQITAGNADIRGRFRSMLASVSAGNLSVDGLQYRGSADLKVGAGTLTAELEGKSRGVSNFHVGAGQVKLTLGSGAAADISADVAMGEITGMPGSGQKKEGMHFGERRHGRTGIDDPKVDIRVGTGAIKVESSDRLQASTVLEEEASPKLEIESGDDDQDIQDIDKTVQNAVREAMKEVHASLQSLPKGLDMQMDSLKSLKELDGMDKDLAKSLANIGPMIEQAMKNSKPDIEKAMRTAKPEIEKAMKEARSEIEKSMKGIKPEIEEAIREAMEEVRKALKDLDRADKIHSD